MNRHLSPDTPGSFEYPPAPPAPQEAPLREAPRFWRRNLFKAALSVGAGLYIADTMTGDTIWSREEPEILEFPAAYGAPNDFMTLITAGFNSSATPIIARDLYPTLSQFGRVGALIDSDMAYNPDTYYKVIRNHVRETATKRVLLLDESMAPVVTSEPAARLMAEDGVELYRIFDCSPDGFDTVKGDGRKVLIDTLVGAFYAGLKGGPGIRVLLETVGFKMDNKDEDWGDSFLHSVRKISPVIPSNIHTLSRLAALREFDHTLYTGPFQEVPYGYIHPVHPWQDNVVNDLGAIEGWQTGRRDRIAVTSHPETGHANPGQHPEAYNSMIHWLINRAFEIKTAEQRRATILLQNAVRSKRIQ